MHRRIAVIALFGAILALTAGTAQATVLRRKNLEELYNDSELIFVGTLASKVVDLDDSGLPWTLYTFNDLEIIDGQFVGQKFSLRCPGGIMDGIVAKVHGTPDLQVGDTSLIFFDQHAWCQIAGWFQGSYKLVDEPQGGNDKILVDHQGRGVLGIKGKDFDRGERVWTPGRIGPEGISIPVQRQTSPAQLLKDGKPSTRASVAAAAVVAPVPARWATFKQALKTRFMTIPGRKRNMTPVAAVSQTAIAGSALARGGQSVQPRGAQP